MKKINFPIENLEELKNLSAGEMVLISGIIYTARDAAHEKIEKLMDTKEKLPFDLKNQCIYYVGPTPSKEGEVIGSCGPTSSYRMDKYTKRLYDNGLKATIGKGPRSEEIVEACKINNSIYFAAIGGTACLLSDCVEENTLVAYEELGAEAIRKLKVLNFPVVVIFDTEGNNLME